MRTWAALRGFVPASTVRRAIAAITVGGPPSRLCRRLASIATVHYRRMSGLGTNQGTQYVNRFVGFPVYYPLCPAWGSYGTIAADLSPNFEVSLELD
jgi:hypothetical protein